MDMAMQDSRRRRAMLILALAACVPAAGLGLDARSAPPADQATATPSTLVQQDVFSKDELASLLAPVALYPDALLAQVLMASTYPGDIADATKWSKAHPDAKGDAAVKAVANEDWDPSVQALVAFPQALLMLGHDIAWTQKLGDAFLAQPDDVMRSVQELRKMAQSAGNLKSDEHQKVSQEAATAAAPQTIVIEASDPDVVYVPTYDPSYMYGGWGYAYPPYYYPPSVYYPPGAAFVGGIFWGAAIAGGLWGDLDWNNSDIDIDVDRYNNFERNIDRERGERGNREDRQANRGERGRGDNTWQHDGSRRDGVPYRDQASREKFGNRQPGAENRAGFRGEDAARTQSREQARQSMQRQGMDPARTNQQARDRASTASRDPRSSQVGGGRADGGYRQSGGGNMASRDAARSGGYGGSYGGGSRNNAFSGASNTSASRAASNRGSASRSGASRSSSAGRSMSRPSRGGGGGRRR